jgi:hypothetical protein
MRTKLTSNMKAKLYPGLVHRDGDVCFYDEMPFTQEIEGLQRTFDHLNNDEFDNRIENLVLCHSDCNQKKKNDYDMQLKAIEKLRINVSSGSLGGRENLTTTYESSDELTEGEVNRIINKLTTTYLQERLPDKDQDTFLSFSDTLNSITYLVQQDTKGRGSQVAVRRAIDVRCCSIGEFMIQREDGKRIIRRRRTEKLQE